MDMDTRLGSWPLGRVHMLKHVNLPASHPSTDVPHGHQHHAQATSFTDTRTTHVHVPCIDSILDSSKRQEWQRGLQARRMRAHGKYINERFAKRADDVLVGAVFAKVKVPMRKERELGKVA
eukprot:4772176-Amphidinium_carterae.1